MAKEIRTSSRMWGMPSTRSISPMMSPSANRPKVAAISPMAQAMAALTAAVSSPMRMLMDRPATVRTNMSRPIKSVPKGY